jgi:hypothetical protein
MWQSTASEAQTSTAQHSTQDSMCTADTLDWELSVSNTRMHTRRNSSRVSQDVALCAAVAAS